MKTYLMGGLVLATACATQATPVEEEDKWVTRTTRGFTSATTGCFRTRPASRRRSTRTTTTSISPGRSSRASVRTVVSAAPATSPRTAGPSFLTTSRIASSSPVAPTRSSAPTSARTAPNADVSTVRARREAYSMLLNRGVIRIGLPIPSNAQFTLSAVDDPYDFASAAQLSLFRVPARSRARTSTSWSTVMWDGRETFVDTWARRATAGRQLLQRAVSGQVLPLARLRSRRPGERGDARPRAGDHGPDPDDGDRDRLVRERALLRSGVHV